MCSLVIGSRRTLDGVIKTSVLTEYFANGFNQVRTELGENKKLNAYSTFCKKKKKTLLTAAHQEGKTSYRQKENLEKTRVYRQPFGTAHILFAVEWCFYRVPYDRAV